MAMSVSPSLGAAVADHADPDSAAPGELADRGGPGREPGRELADPDRAPSDDEPKRYTDVHEHHDAELAPYQRALISSCAPQLLLNVPDPWCVMGRERVGLCQTPDAGFKSVSDQCVMSHVGFAE